MYVDEYSNHGLFKGNRFYGYGKQFYGRMRVSGDYHRIEGNDFTEVFSDALILNGKRLDVLNNSFYRHGLEPGSTIMHCNGSRELFDSHNTFSYFTRNAMRYYPYLSEYSYNLFEHGCRTSWDTAYINRDLVYSSADTTLEHALSNGTWTVTLTMGDAAAAHDQMQVVSESSLMEAP